MVIFYSYVKLPEATPTIYLCITRCMIWIIPYDPPCTVSSCPPLMSQRAPQTTRSKVTKNKSIPEFPSIHFCRSFFIDFQINICHSQQPRQAPHQYLWWWDLTARGREPWDRFFFRPMPGTSTVLKSHQAGKVTSSPWHGGDTEKSHQVAESHIREEESPWHSLFHPYLEM